MTIKKFVYLSFIIFAYFHTFQNGIVQGQASNSSRPLEDVYTEIGYKTPEEAIEEIEQHFKRDLKLPLRVPPVSFTHNFGRFNNLEGIQNDSLEIEYIHEGSSKYHYKIDVRPIEAKIQIKDNYIAKRLKLHNGSEALHVYLSGDWNALVFEKGHWQYWISVDNRLSKKVTLESLIGIANSIHYDSK
ncbi:hypothetical protein [Pontibacillus salipaludis]|uniref:DUF4367 domain-containing protein n=1 Tax=Pontibacillus salipaludis TaxID=1697394 RepID=A0ABQ1Q3P0_9BACI|nr:hypothetical protein [Pontibacillus salipaludis]GGD12217.1 hypothetical protein GCM10011389_19700 [Pontibacillus salipaludis]